MGKELNKEKQCEQCNLLFWWDMNKVKTFPIFHYFELCLFPWAHLLMKPKWVGERNQEASTAVPDAWPRHKHCGMHFLKMIFKLGLGILEILSRDFSAHKLMDVLWKFAVHVYCREKTALLWTVMVLADTSVQPHLLPMPQKFIVFFGINEMYRSSKGAMYDSIDGRNSCLIFAVRFSPLTYRLARGGVQEKKVNIFWAISS